MRCATLLTILLLAGIIRAQPCVMDTIPPVMRCQDFTFFSTSTGEIYVHRDFILAEAYDNCTDSADLCITMNWYNGCGDVLYSTNDPRIDAACIYGIYDLEIVVSDQSNNMASCQVKYSIYKGTGHCDPFYFVDACVQTTSGKIITPVWDYICCGGEIYSSGQQTECLRFYSRHPYSEEIKAIPRDLNYLDPSEGLNTLDLIILRRHLSGDRPFDTPYKFIAADINKSGNVSLIDVVRLRELLLGRNYQPPRKVRYIPMHLDADSIDIFEHMHLIDTLLVPACQFYGTETINAYKVGDLDLNTEWPITRRMEKPINYERFTQCVEDER